MAFSLFMFGLGAVLLGLAWGLTIADVASPLILLICLVVAGIGTRAALSLLRRESPDWGPEKQLQKRKAEQQRYFQHRRRSLGTDAEPSAS